MKRFEAGSAYLSLFGSMSTLICCALPATLVFLGAGATFASLITAFPQLIWISEYKIWFFSGAGILLGLSGYLQFFKPQVCPADPIKGKACSNTKRLAQIVYFCSLALYVVGFFFAFILPSLI